jgi:peroxiredoxin
MTIQVGDKLPGSKFKIMQGGEMTDITSEAIFAGKKVVIFAVPGAFTPTCSAQHLPGFVEKADEIRAEGGDAIACVSVNDAFVMDAWGRAQGVGDKVLMLADGNGDFAKALGLDFDGSGIGFGIRSQRYALVAEDGVVVKLAVDKPMTFEVSSAEAILKEL